jgi:hypothetical protein
LIIEKRKKEGFNVSEWFEEKFSMEYIPPIKKLEEEKKMHLELAEACDRRICELSLKEIDENKLILSQKEHRLLLIACNPLHSNKRQWGIFCTNTHKKLTLEEFTRLRIKYLDQIYS